MQKKLNIFIALFAAILFGFVVNAQAHQPQAPGDSVAPDRHHQGPHHMAPSPRDQAPDHSRHHRRPNDQYHGNRHRRHHGDQYHRQNRHPHARHRHHQSRQFGHHRRRAHERGRMHRKWRRGHGKWRMRRHHRRMYGELTVERITKHMARRLARRGNPNIKLGKVEKTKKGLITADIVTKNNSLVRRYVFDPKTGRRWPADRPPADPAKDHKPKK